MDDFIALPPLLYLICIMSAMSFVVSSGLWFYRNTSKTFEQVIWIGQAQGFVWAMILSIALGQSFDILGEVVVLAVALFFGYRYTRETLVFGGLCLAGWVFTFVCGFGLFALAGDLTFAVFISGLLWLVPIFVFYRRRPASGKIYNYLWPVLVAYMVLLFPLLIQKNINTEEWQGRKYERPLRKA